MSKAILNKIIETVLSKQNICKREWHYCIVCERNSKLLRSVNFINDILNIKLLSETVPELPC